MAPLPHTTPLHAWPRLSQDQQPCRADAPADLGATQHQAVTIKSRVDLGTTIQGQSAEALCCRSGHCLPHSMSLEHRHQDLKTSQPRTACHAAGNTATGRLQLQGARPQDYMRSCPARPAVRTARYEFLRRCTLHHQARRGSPECTSLRFKV